MSEEIIYEPDGDGFEVPDTPHMNIMFDAMEHTLEVEGTESLPRLRNNLTEAQNYAAAVLDAAGVLSMRNVTGNEDGVFSAIGNGFKAVWEYITKTFKSIWDFFFSRDSDKKADEAKDDIKDKTEELSKAAAGTQTDEEANKQASKLKGGVDGAAEKALDEAKTPAEKKAAIKNALAEYAKMNDKGKAKLKKTIDAAVNAKKAIIEASSKDGSKKETAAKTSLTVSNSPAMHLMVDMMAEAAKQNMNDTQFIKTLQGVESITTVQAAVAFGSAAGKNVDQVHAVSKAFNAKKSAIDKVIKDTEKKLKSAKDEGDKKTLTAEVGALRTLMVGATRLAKLIEANYNRVRAVNNDLVALFGIGNSAVSETPETI